VPEAPAPTVETAAPKAEAPPTLDTSDIKEVKGRHPQVQAAAKLLQDKKMSREEFEKYVDYYRPIEMVEADKLYPPSSVESMVKAIRGEENKKKINVPIADGTRIGLRMDLPAREKGVPVVSINEGKPNNDPKTGKPYKSS
jgi:predicted acyl esterase